MIAHDLNATESYLEAVLPEGSVARFDPVNNRLVTWDADGILKYDSVILLDGGRYRVFLNRVTMGQRKPLSEEKDLVEAFLPASGFCYGIYWQYFGATLSR